jgi:DNA-directed RNA polymerase specialized sigma24 family protein
MIEQPDPRTLKRLRHAIRNLPRDQHEVFCAARFEDLGYEQIAQRTGLAVRQVEHLLAEALLTITQEMDSPTRRRWWRHW